MIFLCFVKSFRRERKVNLKHIVSHYDNTDTDVGSHPVGWLKESDLPLWDWRGLLLSLWRLLITHYLLLQSQRPRCSLSNVTKTNGLVISDGQPKNY